MRGPRGAILLLTLLLLVTRVAWLDVDPSLYKPHAELTDEGFWAHNARAAVVLGREFPDDLAQSPAAAPLFHWLVRGVFQIPASGSCHRGSCRWWPPCCWSRSRWRWSRRRAPVPPP